MCNNPTQRTHAHTKSYMLSFPLHQCSSIRRRAHFTHHVTTGRICRNKLHVFGMWNTFLVVSVASFVPNTNWHDYKIQWKVFMYLHPSRLPRVDFRATDVENCSPSPSLTTWLHQHLLSKFDFKDTLRRTLSRLTSFVATSGNQNCNAHVIHLKGSKTSSRINVLI